MGLFGLLVAVIWLLLNGIVRPGTNVYIQDALPARGLPSDTGTWFVCGTSDQGPLTPVLIQSMQDFVRWFGNRATYSILYDALDVFFAEGGRTAFVQRVVGPGAVVATKNLLDAGAAVSLVASALGPGVYANTIKVGVVAGVAGGTFQIQVTDNANVVLEQSGDLANQNAAIAWAQNSQYIRLALGASANNPAVVAAAVMAGGTDDRVNITNAQWQTALDKFSEDLGFGQVSFPGQTSDLLHLQLNAHAAARHRIALLDLPDTAVEATLDASAVAARTNGRWSSSYTPWAVGPGFVVNTTRTVPYSAVQAGLIARSDATKSLGQPAAGENGVSQWATGLSQPAFDDPTRQRLNGMGINVAVVKSGGVRTYGFRTLVDQATDPTWVALGGVRVLGAFAYKAKAILDQHLFDEIDGQGRLFKQIYGRVAGEALLAFNANDLYGATPQDAFQVVCDNTNNTPATVADHQLNCSVALRTSEMAEMMNLTITRVPINQAL